MTRTARMVDPVDPVGPAGPTGMAAAPDVADAVGLGATPDAAGVAGTTVGVPFYAASAAPPLTPPTTGAPHARAGSRLPRGRTLVIGALVIVLGVGGGIAYEVLKPAPTTPASVVQQYFDDLGKGDTASALALVSGAGQLTSQASTALLVPQALSSAANRPTDVQVGNTTMLPGLGQGSISAVKVSYKVGDTSTAASFPVLKASAGSKSPYLLEAPFFDLEVGDPGGRAVTINGISVDLSQTSSFYAFPGLYTATAQGNALLAGDTQTGTLSSSALSSAATEEITFGAPQLASGAQDAVQAQVKQQMDTCAQSTDPYPNGCPFNLDAVYIDGIISSVQWSITNYPNVTVTAASQASADEQADFTDSADDGLAHYVATYTDYNGETQTASGDVSFSVSGTAAVSGSGITLNFSNVN